MKWRVLFDTAVTESGVGLLRNKSCATGLDCVRVGERVLE